MKDVLHFAPEPCISRRLETLQGLNYITADSCASDYAIPGMYKMDITDIRFPDASFDLIIASHIMEHVPDDLRAMREVRRVLRPDGVALLPTPFETNRIETYEDWSITTREGREKAFGQWDHVRVYSRRDYIRRLRESGWEVDDDDRFINAIPEDERRRFGLIITEEELAHRVIFICRPKVATGAVISPAPSGSAPIG